LYYANDWKKIAGSIVDRWCPSVTGATQGGLPSVNGGNDGVLTNIDRNTAWVTSGGKGALNFDGTDDRVVIPKSNAITSAINSSSFTLSAWIYLASTSDCQAIWSTASTATTINQLTFSVGTPVGGNLGRITVAVRNTSGGAGGILSGGTTLSSNQWYFVAVSRRSDNRWDVWLDGNSDGNTTNASVAVKIDDYAIGYDDRLTTNFFNGHIDDVTIFNTALTASEFCFLNEQGRGGGMLHEPPKRRSVFVPTLPLPVRRRSSRFLAFPG
jgi:hypothetical protein